ncbi:hypothetical protein ASD89_18530 [Caulobacter sp. Root656]|nr:hypothetical protein ASD89_18530 [Caulobacter sp. Root656]
MRSPKTPTVLVIGATGKTGRRLVPELRARGAAVRAASRRAAEGLTPFDWGRPETFAPALSGADAVYLVPPAFVEDPTAATGALLDEARRAGVGTVVLLSSLGATFAGEPEGSGRRRLERQVTTSGLDWTILRPTGFNQNFSEGFLLPGILQADKVVTAAGDGAVAHVDAGDIAAVAAVALTAPGHAGAAYAVTGPQALDFDAAAALIGQAAGRTITHAPLPSAAFGDILKQAGVPDDYLAMVLRDQAGIEAGAAAVVTDVVARVTGRPAVAFADYARGAAGAWARSAAA